MNLHHHEAVSNKKVMKFLFQLDPIEHEVSNLVEAPSFTAENDNGNFFEIQKQNESRYIRVFYQPALFNYLFGLKSAIGGINLLVNAKSRICSRFRIKTITIENELSYDPIATNKSFSSPQKQPFEIDLDEVASPRYSIGVLSNLMDEFKENDIDVRKAVNLGLIEDAHKRKESRKFFIQ